MLWRWRRALGWTPEEGNGHGHWQVDGFGQAVAGPLSKGKVIVASITTREGITDPITGAFVPICWLTNDGKRVSEILCRPKKENVFLLVSNSKLNFLLRTIEQIVEQLFGKLTERCITLDSFERMVYVQIQEASRRLDFEVSYYSMLDIYCEVRYFVRVAFHHYVRSCQFYLFSKNGAFRYAINWKIPRRR